MNLNWGDVPTWITVVVAAAGLLYGAWNIRVSRALALRSQARSVYVVSRWLEPIKDESGMRMEVRVVNGSALPIHRVTLRLSQYGTFDLAPYEPAVNAGSDWTYRSREIIATSLTAHPDNYVAVDFTDNSGWQWLRHEFGPVMPVYRPLNEGWRSSWAGKAFRRVVPGPIRRFFRGKFRESRFRPPYRKPSRRY